MFKKKSGFLRLSKRINVNGLCVIFHEVAYALNTVVYKPLNWLLFVAFDDVPIYAVVKQLKLETRWWKMCKNNSK